jgi:hypothetical protein
MGGITSRRCAKVHEIQAWVKKTLIGVTIKSNKELAGSVTIKPTRIRKDIQKFNHHAFDVSS